MLQYLPLKELEFFCAWKRTYRATYQDTQSWDEGQKQGQVPFLLKDEIPYRLAFAFLSATWWIIKRDRGGGDSLRRLEKNTGGRGLWHVPGLEHSECKSSSHRIWLGGPTAPRLGLDFPPSYTCLHHYWSCHVFLNTARLVHSHWYWLTLNILNKLKHTF